MPTRMTAMQEQLDNLNTATQPVVMGLAGAIFFGYTVSDWLTVIAIVVGLLNIAWISTRLIDWVVSKFKK
jgi:hypothetical protein